MTGEARRVRAAPDVRLGDSRGVGRGDRAQDPSPRDTAAGADDVGEQAERAARTLADRAVNGGGDAPSRVIELLGRFGLVAYGAVHLLVAGLGVRLALGVSATEVDQRGAVAAVASTGPPGVALLAAFVVGLSAFAVWQASAAVGGFRWVSGGERRRKRIGAAAKAVAVVAIAVIAVRFIAGIPSAPGHTGAEWLGGLLLEVPGGRWLVAGVAGFVLVVAATMIYTAASRSFLGDLVEDLPTGVRHTAAVLGAAGNLARSIVFGGVGLLFADAALHADPTRVGGVNEAVRDLVGEWHTAVPLLLLSAGIAAFGVYCLIDSRYRRA